MKQAKSIHRKKHFLNSWFTALISISMVLVMLGMLSLILINARHLTEYVREKVGFTLVLRENIKEVEVLRLQKVLNTGEYVKSTRYIDKETAARELTEELGEDFTGFLGYNPLFASLDVKLNAAYTESDSLKMLEQKFLKYPQVSEVYYQKNLLTLINKNLKKISLLISVVSALLLVIFFGLINNTIRMLIYAQRFTINTMLMVGATKNYIRLPFLRRSLWLGVSGAALANIILIGIIYTYEKELSGLISITDLWVILSVSGIVWALGILISLVSTWLAVNKFLRLKFDELFY